MRAERASGWCRRSYSLLEFAADRAPPLSAANTPSIRQCRYAACSETWRATCSPYGQADPGLVACKGC